MRLRDLARNLDVKGSVGDLDRKILGIQYDSRLVAPGDLFCASPGARTDGHRFCQEAQTRGASAVLVNRVDAIPPGLPGIVVNDVRHAMAIASDILFDSPSRQLWMIGITGTNGKTTVAHLTRTILEAAEVPCGLMGTIHSLIGHEAFSSVRTTPEAPDLQRMLRYMIGRGMHAAVMEVSSQALALKRVVGVAYDVAVFTNLSQEHLDFHKDFEAYYQAKAQLFRSLTQEQNKGPKAAVVNGDDPYGQRFAQESSVPVLTYGLSSDADIRGEQVKISCSGSEFTVVLANGCKQRVRLPMAGQFNVLNALAAITVGYLMDIDVQVMAAALGRSPGVPGRFERIDLGQPFTVIVDYAHTPAGLENVLKTAREFTQGRVFVVFGCGGDRDHDKRAMMGQIAGRHADWVVLTTDNPRSEDPVFIVSQIEQGVRAVNGHWTVQLDREDAIRTAILRARPGDVVMIVGKGHESYQIYGDTSLDFDDREVARQVLRE